MVEERENTTQKHLVCWGREAILGLFCFRKLHEAFEKEPQKQEGEKEREFGQLEVMGQCGKKSGVESL